MARKTMKRSRRGGGYGFGGSILENQAGANAGNVEWKSTGGECGAARVGNDDLPKLGGRRHRYGRTLRGGSSDAAGGAGAMDSGVPAADQGRGGNEYKGGRRRRNRRVSKKSLRRHGRRRSTLKGGSNTLALQQPRASYTFNGNGAAGISDAVPVSGNVTYV